MDSLKSSEINENLYGKPLNHDWVARDVFPIHLAPLQSQVRLLAAVREMSPRCFLKRVDEDNLFQAFRQWGAVRSKKEREEIKTREGGEGREGRPVVQHRPPQSSFYFSSLSFLPIPPHYLKACPGKGQDEEQDWTRKSGGLEIEPIVWVLLKYTEKFFPCLFCLYKQQNACSQFLLFCL